MILRPSFYNLCSLDFLNLIWPLTHNPHQKDLDGTEDVHGPGERGAQIETQSHSTSKLRAQRSWDHVVRASSWGKTSSNIIKCDTGRQALEGRQDDIHSVVHFYWKPLVQL